MIPLLQVELKKIFTKKSIYIIWGLMLIFCFLNNFLYWKDYDENGNYKYLEQEDLNEEKNRLEQELKNYNQENSSEVTMYITIKTKLDILELKQKFSSNSWQYQKINDYLYDTIYQVNYFIYIEKDNSQVETWKEKYQLLLNKLYQNDYQYFLNQEIKSLTENKKSLTEEYNQELDKKTKQDLSDKIEEIEFQLNIINYRLLNQIKEDNSYLNIALEDYQENYKIIKYYDSLNKPKTYQETLEYREALKNEKISKYIIDNKQSINKQNNLNYQLRTIVEDYEIFFVILILIVSSSIICDEFKDGTIKLLLIKPYSRGKILLSKYLTAIIVLFISILLLILMQLTIGGFFFSFSSLKIPVVIYDFNKSKLVEYSVFWYMIIRVLAKIPFFFLLITISSWLSVLSNNIIISMTLPLMLYMFNSTFIHLARQYQLEWMKYLVNINWNLENYLFGNLSELSFLNVKFSILILLGYFSVLLILTFTIFQKKNIKNI